MSESVFIQEGAILDHVAAAELSAGDIMFLGTICVQVVTDAAVGQLVGLRSEGVIRLTKDATSDTYSDGAVVYWDDEGKVANTEDQSDGTVGKAVNGGSANGDVYVYVKLNA